MSEATEHRSPSNDPQPDESTRTAAREALDASDPYAREQQIFPVLTDEQVERMLDYGTVEDCEAGESLFERGPTRRGLLSRARR